MRIRLIILATLLIAIPIFSFATEYYIATSDLNVKTGAGTRHSVSFTIKKGDEVELLSKGTNWYKIKYLGRTGYVSSKFLKFNNSLSDTEANTNTEQQIVTVLLVSAYAGFALFIGFIVYVKIRNKNLLLSVTDKSRGTKSERDLVLELLKFGIPSQNIFHDLYVYKRKGQFSQADVVVATKVGLLVFEVKDYSGWIFGNGNQSQWTKVLAYGRKKFYFYNPIMQNNAHVSELRRQLCQFEDIPFYSIIVFYGDCKLKNINFVPNGTFIVKSKRVLEVVKIILRDNKPFAYTDENAVIRKLREAVMNGGNAINIIQHSENIKDMLGTHRVYD